MSPGCHTLTPPVRSHIRIYQPQLALLFILGVVVAVLLYPSRETGQPFAADYVYSSLVLGEILLPPTAGWLASGIMLRDPFREVVLTTPYSQARLVLERLSVLLAAALLAWLAVLLFIWQLAGQPQINLLKLGLAALPAMLLFGATGLWSGLRLRAWVGGGFCVTLLWGSGLVFRHAWLGLPLFYPFLTYFAAEHSEHPAWWMNRLLLCVVAGVLIGDACRLVNNEELLLSAGREDA